MSNIPSNLQSAIELFMFHCQYEKNLNKKTLAAYALDLSQFSTFIASMQLSFTDITLENIRDFLKKISHYKPKTIKRKMATLKALFNYIEFEYENFYNPIRRMRVHIKVPSLLPNVLTSDEVKKILQYLYSQKRQISVSSDHKKTILLRKIALVELLFGTGLRIYELCALTTDTIDLQAGIIRVYGKGSKERIIQICQPPILESLRDYRESLPKQSIKPEPFFLNCYGKKLEPQSVRSIVKKLTKEAGITKRVTPHTFRHTFATLLLEEGVDIKYIQTILGHSSLSTTQIYTHVTNTSQRLILRDYHPRRKIEV